MLCIMTKVKIHLRSLGRLLRNLVPKVLKVYAFFELDKVKDKKTKKTLPYKIGQSKMA